MQHGSDARPPVGRVRVDGKQFAVERERFRFSGVTYGTFRPREDGERFPERARIKRDFEAMNEAGFTVVRTYTLPPDDLIGAAADAGLRIVAGAFWPDWRYLLGASKRQVRALGRNARTEVRRAAHRLAGCDQVLALVLGNEVPADVVRWLGEQTVSAVLEDLADVVRDEDPSMLVTYANYPSAEYLHVDSVDFLTFNVFLEDRRDFRAYLTRLHTLAGDRPLVLGEIGLDAGPTAAGERRQAEVLDWQLEVAAERGVAGTCLFSWSDEWWVGDGAIDGWHFGLTTADRRPRPALAVAARRNRMRLVDLRPAWPFISVVVCAYNAAETLDECLRHTCALDYPALEVVVVDDGSTDDTARIARDHPRARLVTIPHAGLSTARNEGLKAATGELVAYLDSDAYPSPEWPYYLVLGLDRPSVGGVGGPNLPPVDDPAGAQVVARSPGGPVHVLIADDRAEHVPGCNMAFWRPVLEEVGGFDPVYTAAGDDVDLCWKVLDRRWEIGFHPAALVWHHRRPGLRRYLRQQRGYGRAEALVQARHPGRFSPIGTARWRGRIYNSLTPPFARSRIYRGMYATAAYQSVYQGGGYGIDLAHQVGVPLATVALVTAPSALVDPLLAAPAAAGLLLMLVLGAVDVFRAQSPRDRRFHRLRFRARIALHQLLQPLVRTWGRLRAGAAARQGLPPVDGLPAAAMKIGGTVILPQDRPRGDLAAALVTHLRWRGIRISPPTGWEDHDGRLALSALISGDVLTSSHAEGFVQVRIRSRLRRGRAALALAVVATLFVTSPPAAGIVAVLVAGEVARGKSRTGWLIPAVLRGGRA